MTTLDDVRRELRERFEHLEGGKSGSNPVDDLEKKYREWIEKVEFDFETGKWKPSLTEAFTHEELVKLRGRRRAVRYVEDDFKQAHDRLERAKRRAKECDITGMMRATNYFRDYIRKALDNLREGEKYGLPKEEAFNLLIKFKDYTPYELEKEVEVAYELMKGCNIQPTKVAWSRFGKMVLEKKGLR